jgi:hypothetical protein
MGHDMAITGVARPATVGLQVGVERPSVGPVQGAVATELAQAVSAIEASDPARLDPLRIAAAQSEANVILDAQSREVIFRAIEFSRRVTRQVPETAARRLKAYARPAPQAPAGDDPHADIEV